MVTKAKSCQMEFYFKRKDLEKLIKANPNSDGIIIKQSIKPTVLKDKTIANISKIEAYATPSEKTALKLSEGAEFVIEGCPFPPGC